MTTSTRDQAEALIRYGSSTSWPDGTPDYDLGTRFDKCSWPVWDQKMDGGTRTVRLWRNPDLSAPGMWDEPIRYGTIEEWIPKPKKASGFFLFQFLKDWRQAQLNLEAIATAARTPLRIPWGQGWGGDQGTTDNGIIINCTDGTSYEILGMQPLGAIGAATLNARVLADPNNPVAFPDDFRCDFVRHRRPPGHPSPSQPRDTQGPQWRADGMLTPDHVTRMCPTEFRLVIFNTSFGPTAKAFGDGWTEHKGSTPAYNPEIKREPGSTDKSVDCYQPFTFDITDAQIEAWIANASPETAHLASARRWYARNLRGYFSDADKGSNTYSSMRVCVSGTGRKILESVGWRNPRLRKAWAEAGIKSANDAVLLGQDILRYGTLTEIKEQS